MLTRFHFIAGLVILTLMAACNPMGQMRLPDFRTLGELRVAVREDAISFRQDESGEHTGFEYELLMALGQRLGVPVRFDVYPDATRALDAVLQGEAHLAAAGLTSKKHLPLAWSPPLRELDYVLVTRSGSKAADAEQFAGLRLGARRGTPADDALDALQKQHPSLRIQHSSGVDEQALLEQVAAGELDLAAADRMHYAIAANYFPELEVVRDLAGKADLAWAINREGGDGLVTEVERFIGESRAQGLLARLADRYYGHARRLSEVDVSVFLERMQSVLPNYRAHFQSAQAATGIDWRLLAALSYQESHWDPLATSFTGVRGIMMLTTGTADHFGVSNRLDPKESILGGARYLALLLEQLPDEVPEADRNWMSIAAYNIGQGHFNGARSLARSLQRDDDSWFDMKAVLPLLAKPEYAARLKGGRARGGEAVALAENVRSYYDILQRFEKPYTPLLQPPRFSLGGKAPAAGTTSGRTGLRLGRAGG